MDPYLSAFNNLVIKFLNELILIFPEENDFKIYKRGIEFINSTHKKKVCELFKVYIILYKENILKKNEEFFLNNNYHEIINDNKNDSQGLEVVIQKLKNYWKTLSDNNKSQIWEYLSTLIKLSDMVK